MITVSCKDTVTALRKAIVAAHFPNSQMRPDQYRIWKLDESHERGEQHITTKYLEFTSATQVEDSDKTLDDALIDNSDSFVIEIKKNGYWAVDEDLVRPMPGEIPLQVLSDSTEEAAAPRPLFGQGTDFFSKMQFNIDSIPATSSASTVVPSQSFLKPAAPIKPTFTKDPRPVKVNKLLPGTLGLGNM